MSFWQKFNKAISYFLLVNNNLCEKLLSSLESAITFDERFKVTSVPLCVPDLI